MSAHNPSIPISLARAAAAAAIAAAIAAAGCGHAPPDAAPLGKLRDATGGERWDRIAIIHGRGTLSVGGLAGELTFTEDVRDGRSRSEYTLGPVSGAGGWDGRARWRRAPGGEVTVADDPEEVARAETEAWLIRRGYLRGRGARYRELAPRELEGRRHAVIEAVPDRGAPVELWIDGATHLLSRTVHREGRDTVVTSFGDHREVGGVRLPFRTIIDRGDPRNRITIQLASAELAPDAPPAAFAAPPTVKDSVGFTGAARQTELPFDLINNHIYISAEINGQPARVLVDTGGLNVLTQAAAKRLGVTPHGKLAGRGAGGKEVDLSLARASSLVVGELRAKDPVFYVFEMEDLADVEGTELDGIVGFELFHRFAVRIDYAGRRIRLTDPAAFTPPSQAIRVPFVLKGHMPRVEGAIDGVPARLTIDTGARNSITAGGPYVEKHGLIARYRPRFETVTGWGVGGPVRTWPVRLGEVALGGAVVRGVAGDLFTGDRGAHADPDTDGNVGGGILRRFTVTFDYGQRAMYLEPNAALAERDPYDRAGVFLRRAGDALDVAAVAPASPAERAGLRVGDRITAIDGAAVTSRPLPEWRRKLREEPVGTRIALALLRDGQRTTAVLTLAEILP